MTIIAKVKNIYKTTDEPHCARLTNKYVFINQLCPHGPCVIITMLPNVLHADSDSHRRGKGCFLLFYLRLCIWRGLLFKDRDIGLAAIIGFQNYPKLPG